MIFAHASDAKGEAATLSGASGLGLGYDDPGRTLTTRTRLEPFTGSKFRGFLKQMEINLQF